MHDKDKITSYYDQFSEEQERRGVNDRHLSILDKLIQTGLQAHHKVLEVGCGIGTVSQLISSRVKNGQVLAVDISPESIEKAQSLWGKQHPQLHFEVSDMKDFHKEGEKYDFVVFPDVLEHIPVDQHLHLFETIKRHSHPDTVIFIHIPAPRFLEWMIRNEPEKLQIIDQPLDSGTLISNIATQGFYLEKMETYAVYYEEKDYQYFIFRVQTPLQQAHHRSKWAILKDRWQRKIRLR